MLKSKGVTHIVNLAGGDLSLGAPHIETSVYEGKHIMIFLCLTQIFKVFWTVTETLAGCFRNDQKCPYLHTSN